MVELIILFQNIPSDILNKILEYTDVLRFRTGKYINRITENDNRINIIKKIPRPLKINTNTYSINLKAQGRQVTKVALNYTFTKNNNVEHMLLYVTDYHVGSNGMQYTKKNYVFDINNNWSQIVSYTM